MRKYLFCFGFLFIVFFSQAKENKDKASKFYMKGQSYLSNKNYKKALSFFTKALQVDSTQSCYWYAFAEAFYHSYTWKDHYDQYYQKAKTYYQKVIELNSDSSCIINAYIGLANLEYYNFFEYLNAMDQYSSAIRLDSTNAAIYKARAEIQEHFFGKSREFGCVISKAIIKYRNDSLRIDRLIKYTDIARNAIKDYLRLIELNYPDAATIYFHCGNIYSKLEEYKEAINYYTKSIEINPSYGIYYLFRAETKHNFLDDVGACEDYKKACKLFDLPMNHSEKKKYCK